MRTGTCVGIIIRAVVATVCLAFFGGTTWAEDPVLAGTFTVEPPTLENAGFEWTIEGDDNRNARVDVSFREKGASEWRDGLPFLRIQGERIVHPVVDVDFTAPNMFAGSIFGLEPGTTYECRFILGDPDGVAGKAERTVEITTRPEPPQTAGGRVLHVYPPGYEGEKEEPSFVSIMEAYYGAGKSLWGSATIKPGDTILVHAGLYHCERRRYYEPLGMHFHGTYHLSGNGTPEQPIIIRGAGDGEVVLDGDGVYRLFDVIYADHTHIEGLTIRNCEVGIMAGLRFTDGCDGLVVRNCRFENVGCGINAQFGGSRNFHIADNTIIGREDSTHTHGRSGMWRDIGPVADLSSFIAIDINGQGHVVRNNYIANFHDGIDITEQGPPEREEWKVVSIDIHNNDIFNCTDDFIEADCGVHNIRVYENRGFNVAYFAYSAQPIYGGPAYFIRNIACHAPSGGAFKFNIHPAGIFVFHNTMITEWVRSGSYSNVHLRNNLFLGTDAPDRPILRAGTYTEYTTFDYNGCRPNRNSTIQFDWRSPGPETFVTYQLRGDDILSGRFETLEEFTAATGREEHGVIVDYDIFRNVRRPDPDDPGRHYYPQDFDFRLRPGSKAVDAGTPLPNINDDFSGEAPDLGAIELGAEPPVYGPRPWLYEQHSR